MVIAAVGGGLLKRDCGAHYGWPLMRNDTNNLNVCCCINPINGFCFKYREPRSFFIHKNSFTIPMKNIFSMLYMLQSLLI